MKTEPEVRQALRDWVVKTSGRISVEDLRDDTPLIERRIITSLQVMDLLLFLESLSGQPIDPGRLKPGVFRDVDAIWRNFFAAASA